MILPAPNRLVFPILSVICGCVFAAPLLASDFPKKPIKLIVPFSPGGGSDTAGRLLKRAIDQSGSLSLPFVIVNVPGGGGTIGSRRVKNALPDGHTLLLLHEGMFTAPHSGQTTYGAEAFEPVAAFGSTGIFLAIASDSPIQNLPELVVHCKKNPNSLSFACNFGAPAHFIGLQLARAAGDIQLRFVPSGGGAKRYGDLIGGEVETTIFSATEYASFQGGGIRALAYLGSERHPDFPDIPTAAEQGIPLEAANLQFVWAPASTPQPVVLQLADAIEEALTVTEIRAEMKKLHVDPIFFKGDPLLAEIETREAAIAAVASSSPEIFPWFPHIVGGLCLGLIAMLAIEKRGTAATSTVPNPVETLPSQSEVKASLSIQRIGFITAAVAYAFALALAAPFVAATAVFTIVSSCILVGRRRWDMRLAFAVALLAVFLGLGCFLMFSRVLSIDLP